MKSPPRKWIWQCSSTGYFSRVVFVKATAPSGTAEQECGAGASAAIEIIEHLALKPRRIPSRSWRELIKKVWEVQHAYSCMNPSQVRVL